ncbi:hypothetical protein PFISCL1PPCAC_13283, partial [Pristionchus fissidentatus]
IDISSMRSIAILLASFGVVAIAQGGFGGLRLGQGNNGISFGGPPPPPPFLATVSRDGQAAFFRIFQDQSLSKAAIKTAIASWASTYGVSAQVDQFEAEIRNAQTQRRANVSEAVGQLNDALTKMAAIEDNQELSLAQTHEQIQEALQAMGDELRDLVLAVSGPPRPRGPGGPGGPGGFGGPGGMIGGPMGGMGGGFGQGGQGAQ